MAASDMIGANGCIFLGFREVGAKSGCPAEACALLALRLRFFLQGSMEAQTDLSEVPLLRCFWAPFSRRLGGLGLLLPLPSWWAWVRFAKKLYIWLEAWLALHVKLEGLLPKTSQTKK